MTREKRLLETLVAISNISGMGRLDFSQKLERILSEIVGAMQAQCGSIMLLKGHKYLEVAASTVHDLIGTKQYLDEESPSSWVVKNKAPLYVDEATETDLGQNRFSHYEKNAFLIVPVISNSKVIGVVNVTEKIGVDSFDKHEQEMLLTIAGQVISAIENDRMAESLRKSKRTIQKKNVRLKRLERLKTDLFNMLIHDLKGPISELVANLDILSYTISDENAQYVESAQTGCDTLYRMVCNLLDVARLEEGKLELVYERIDPKDLIKEALARLFGLCNAKGLRFEEDFAPGEQDASLWGDRTILLRILQNLLSNAIEYSPNNEIIEVGFRHVVSSEIEFFVKDNGPGVPDEHRESIFDKYKQAEAAKDARIGSTGLGLAFCKMAVEAHGGRIGLRSAGEKGSIFGFVLPLGPDRASR